MQWLMKKRRYKSLKRKRGKKQEDLKKEINALRDQFKVANPLPKELLPVQIIGGRNDEIILDKGSEEGIKTGKFKRRTYDDTPIKKLQVRGFLFPLVLILVAGEGLEPPTLWL